MLRAGIIGCGAITERRHARLLRDLAGRVEVAAVADPAEERQAVIGQMVELASDHYYSDYADMLATENLDFVVIATPHHLHAKPTMDAFDAGVHVLIEKPLCMNVEEADAMIDKAKETERSLCVLHNQLFSAATQETIRIIASGEMGDPYFCRSETMGGTPYVGRGADGMWRTRASTCGAGGLIDSGYHQVYRVVAFMGSPVKRVYAKMGTYTTGFDFPDLAVVTLEHENGGVSMVQSGWCAGAGATGVREILLTGGTIRPTTGHAERVWLKKNGAEEAETIELPKPAPDDVGASALLAKFVESLETGSPSPVSGEDAREIMRIIDAALESSATGRAIDLRSGLSSP